MVGRFVISFFPSFVLAQDDVFHVNQKEKNPRSILYPPLHSLMKSGRA